MFRWNNFADYYALKMTLKKCEWAGIRTRNLIGHSGSNPVFSRYF